MLKIFSNGLRFLVHVYKRFNADGCSYRAASLAYTTLLSVVPLTAVSLVVLSVIPGVKDFGDQLETIIVNNFVPTSAELVQQHIHTFVQQTSSLPATSFLFLIITAVLMVFNIEQAFNAIWRVKVRRRGAHMFLLYWGVITLTPVLMGVGMFISTYLISLPIVAGAAAAQRLEQPLLFMAPYVLTYLTFVILYVAVPNCKVSVGYAMMGGLVSTMLFEVAKLGFSLYIVHFPTYQLLYGALAAFPIFLIWIYLSWFIVLIGAEISAVLALGIHESDLRK